MKFKNKTDENSECCVRSLSVKHTIQLLKQIKRIRRDETNNSDGNESVIFERKLFYRMKSDYDLSENDTRSIIELAIENQLIRKLENNGIIRYEINDRMEDKTLKNDWFCFNCHSNDVNMAYEPLIACQHCWRSFHQQCTKHRTRTPFDSILCDYCKIGKLSDHITDGDLQFKKSLLCLVKYCENQMKSDDNDTILSDDQKIDCLVFKKFDIDLIKAKVHTNMYPNIDAFEHDFNKHYSHQLRVCYSSDDQKFKGLFKIERIFKEEVNDLKLCHQCYHHKRTNEEDWFTKPCTPAHQLVYAKPIDYPFWPAKLIAAKNKVYFHLKWFDPPHYPHCLVHASKIRPLDHEFEPKKFKINKNIENDEKAKQKLEKQKEYDEKAKQKLEKQKEYDEKAKQKLEKQKEYDEKAKQKLEKQKEYDEKAKQKLEKQKEYDEKAKQKLEKQKEYDEKAKQKLEKQKEYDEKAKQKLEKQKEYGEKAKLVLDKHKSILKDKKIQQVIILPFGNKAKNKSSKRCASTERYEPKPKRSTNFVSNQVCNSVANCEKFINCFNSKILNINLDDSTDSDNSDGEDSVNSSDETCTLASNSCSADETKQTRDLTQQSIDDNESIVSGTTEIDAQNLFDDYDAILSYGENSLSNYDETDITNYDNQIDYDFSSLFLSKTSRKANKPIGDCNDDHNEDMDQLGNETNGESDVRLSDCLDHLNNENNRENELQINRTPEISCNTSSTISHAESPCFEISSDENSVTFVDIVINDHKLEKHCETAKERNQHLNHILKTETSTEKCLAAEGNTSSNEQTSNNSLCAVKNAETVNEDCKDSKRIVTNNTDRFSVVKRKIKPEIKKEIDDTPTKYFKKEVPTEKVDNTFQKTQDLWRELLSDEKLSEDLKKKIKFLRSSYNMLHKELIIAKKKQS